MTEREKKQDLKRNKTKATGLFLLMTFLFIGATLIEKKHDGWWVGAVKAFSEAAMVGALADWFAVTALFHHPLGLKIKHTNLIKTKKDQIGKNLGDFVVQNFLSPDSIRPFILRLKASDFVIEWLGKDKNQRLIVHQISIIAFDIIERMEDDEVEQFITSKSQNLVKELDFSALVGNGLAYVLNKGSHQGLVTLLAKEIKNYILRNDQIIKEKVKQQSASFVPQFIDNLIAEKITSGLVQYFDELERDQNHDLRDEIKRKIEQIIIDIKTQEHWKTKIHHTIEEILHSDAVSSYASVVWQSIKKTLILELTSENSTLKNSLLKNMARFAIHFEQKESLQNTFDQWVRVTAYKTILNNTHHFASVITSTVGKWDGKELSNKLELEVGKDLQWIRMSGTIVGGTVGLIIYLLASLLL